MHKLFSHDNKDMYFFTVPNAVWYQIFLAPETINAINASNDTKNMLQSLSVFAATLSSRMFNDKELAMHQKTTVMNSLSAALTYNCPQQNFYHFTDQLLPSTTVFTPSVGPIKPRCR